MRDLYFSSIIDSFGEATTSRYVSPEHITKWKTILPDNLLDCWVNEGWSSYQYGLFSFVNPSLYKDVVLEWLDGTHLIEIDNFYVIAISGFGDLYLFGERYGFICRILARYGIIETLSQINKVSQEERNRHIYQIFQTINKKNLDPADIFLSLVKKHGELNDNEIYCFEPSIQKLEKPNFIASKRVNTIDYLLALRKLITPVINFI
ncbi:GAD-like domain-containing protein [Providencia hangzhouensis]|uniref:GAD-like domain-containing protein n=1 Tax=Providencia hangzhouensis TaxID=3031799 RepID=UPI0034DCD80D